MRLNLKTVLLKNKIWILDLIFIAVVLFIMYEPNFATGHVDQFETSNYLPNISATLAGKVPYRDFFVPHGPFQVYIQALFFLLLGSSVYNLFLYFYVTAILTYFILYFLLRLVLKTRILVFIVIIMALTETYHPFWIARWGYFRIGFSLVTIAILIRFILTEKQKYLFFGGIFSALSLFYSIDMGIITILAVLFFLAFHFCYFGTKFAYDFWRRYLIYGLGLIIILLPFLLYLYFNKAAYDYIYTSFYIIPKYFMKTWGEDPKFFIFSLSSYKNIWQLLRSQSFKLYVPLFMYTSVFTYVMYLIFFHKKITKEHATLVLLSSFGFPLYRASFRACESSQFQLAILPFFIIAGMLLEKAYFVIHSYLQESGEQKRRNQLKALACFLTLVLSITYFIFSSKRYYVDLKGWAYYQMHKKELLPYYIVPFPKKLAKMRYCLEPRVGKMMIISKEADDFEQVTNFIRANTKPGEVVFSFPEQGIYNFLTERPCLGRFYVAGMAYTFPKWREELLHDLEKVKPEYIICGRGLSNLARSIDREEEILPEIKEYIDKHYFLAKEFNTVNIYQKRN